MTKSCNLQKYISDEFKTRPLQFKWNQNATQHFCFRLRINEGTGELWRTTRPESENASCEIVHDTISLTDELRQMNGQIIQCVRIDDKWIFDRLRTDRKHPNGKSAIRGKKKKYFYLNEK